MVKKSSAALGNFPLSLSTQCCSAYIVDTLLHCSPGSSENGSLPRPYPLSFGEKDEMQVDMGIQDPEFVQLVNQMEELEKKLFDHPLQKSFQDKKQIKCFQRKAVVNHEIQQLKLKMRESQLQKFRDELKNRSRVLKKLGHIDVDGVEQLKEGWNNFILDTTGMQIGGKCGRMRAAAGAMGEVDLESKFIASSEILRRGQAQVDDQTAQEHHLESVISFYGGELTRAEIEFIKYITDCGKDFNMDKAKDDNGKGFVKLALVRVENWSEDEEDETKNLIPRSRQKRRQHEIVRFREAKTKKASTLRRGGKSLYLQSLKK
ncbi:hypothetical protein GIB67_002319 [Kingdonia uniflora]|uniref:Exosome RNA helicase MTR4-like beta-barrel domain-containing protein n=1 Tax=Kingdonia uniflora TaxID=39325 RepID=A0A7J7KX64_9MAGN|nr:hypothetical protein GIB67_002319 [Kingdonia uniflora]